MGVDTWLDPVLAGLFGLLIGSFLNVAIYRSPKMLEFGWWRDTVCELLVDEDFHQRVFGAPRADSLRQEATRLTAQIEAVPALSLWKPRSRCQTCGHGICWYENIPVFSYLLLRGKCSACGTVIGWRYPAIELVTGALFAFCVFQWGWTPTAAAWCFFCALLLTAALIDWDTTYLPDLLTLGLLWAGLLASSLRWTSTPLDQAVIGAAAGYSSLWLINFIFCKITGRPVAMAAGDFKLFAALGAWFGWLGLIPIILLASLVGSVIGIAIKMTSGLRDGDFIPFGPFLAGAGLLALFWGPTQMLKAFGI